jgi:putative oxidoreductase
MRVGVVIAKVLLGLGFIVFGLDGFLHMFPQPPLPDGVAKEFMGALTATPYFKVVKALEVLGGLLILSGRLAPLGLLILGPVMVNILLFDLFMFPGGLPVILVLGALAAFIGWRHKDYFAPFFKVREDHCTFLGK